MIIRKNKLKIINLRKLTQFSYLLCRNALIKNNWNINKSIIYLRKLESNKKENNSKLIYKVFYSEVNKEKNLGYIIGLKAKTEEVTKNKILLKFLKKILKLCLNYHYKTINDIYENDLIKNELLDKNIMFNDKIIINKLVCIKSNYVYNYNHFNNKIISLIGFKIKKNNKLIKRIIKYISLDIISKNSLFKNNYDILKLNYFYKTNKNIDPLLLKRIRINLKKYIYYLKYINISNYYIIN
ncbi:MAG: hypothetical protein NHG14_00950 [Candidatus Shikimatogenerans bostrichidophilus]|nr:MAG: hypothetical protein NHG14_00950 [Candidatus Shikimatogenerans bostrichidophilus]